MIAKLVLVGGKADKSEVKIRVPLIVGRDRQAGLVISHPTVSRKHCEIVEEDGQLVVRDFGSLNGTLVDDVPIKETVLRPGQTLTVGPLTFRAIYESPAEGEATPSAPAGAAADSVTVQVQEFKPQPEAAPSPPDPGPATQELTPEPAAEAAPDVPSLAPDIEFDLDLPAEPPDGLPPLEPTASSGSGNELSELTFDLDSSLDSYEPPGVSSSNKGGGDEMTFDLAGESSSAAGGDELGFDLTDLPSLEDVVGGAGAEEPKAKGGKAKSESDDIDFQLDDGDLGFDLDDALGADAGKPGKKPPPKVEEDADELDFGVAEEPKKKAQPAKAENGKKAAPARPKPEPEEEAAPSGSAKRASGGGDDEGLDDFLKELGI